MIWYSYLVESAYERHLSMAGFGRAGVPGDIERGLFRNGICRNAVAAWYPDCSHDGKHVVPVSYACRLDLYVLDLLRTWI